MKVKAEWHTESERIVQSALEKILSDFNIDKKVILNAADEPFIKLSRDAVEISLTQKALKSEDIAIPQLKALLLTKHNELEVPVNYQNIPGESFWHFDEILNRHIIIVHGMMPPWNTSTKQFLNLVSDTEIKDKQILDLGTGTGVLAILAARSVGNGKVVAVDIVQKAIHNARFNTSIESNEVQEHIVFGKSDVYSNLKNITGEQEPLFDLIFFNNPVMLGESKKEDSSSLNSYSGNNFLVIKQALADLPKVLKSGGKAFFLVMELSQKIDSIWTKHHLLNALPGNFTGIQACKPLEIDSTIGFASAIYCVYRN